VYSLLDCAFVELPVELPGAERLKTWLARGYAAEMDWMAKPRNDFRGFQAAWIGLWSYPRPLHPVPQKIAAYAQGKDYHFVLKEKLREQAEAFGESGALPFVDSYPVAERELAALAGLGFIGRNTMLIHPKYGSGFFIGGLLLPNSLPYYSNFLDKSSSPGVPGHPCAQCRKCLDACPGGAITEDGFVDSRKCASYLTIEKRAPLTDAEERICSGLVFGCDLCQTVCPYNKRHLRESEPYFDPQETEWRKSTLKGTPLQRAGKRKILSRNLAASAPK
jgi:epoxyqueuosine reductase